ncbi:hypothetical protein [Rhizobium sp. Root1220]|uniref:hypothetical protein n=1 Tax=Rhizobium sp. Root1220 TaxID=1736432 RepID=UPI0006F65B8C|nr:hypothetical protein [Rhizobium sp. Root1220]KQV83286.1 hypothetical protein ASC90_22110 [Rhizobium sp. Root1220]
MSAELNDVEWCVLDLLLRSKRKGVSRVNRMELMRTDAIPDGVKIKLVFTALLMANGPLVRMHGEHDFSITDEGERVFLERFAKPTSVADVIIALPDRSAGAIQ